MTEEKKKNLVTASTAMSVIVMFLLVVVLVYQLVAMSVKKNEKQNLIDEIARLEQEIEDGEAGVELWQQKWKIEERARQLDYVYKKDKENEK
ncbi:MAG: hypothetical protein E7360_02185 [Clostridiales bacterium]|nr:hypothetical protein [Clostridiales bacterium]